MGSIGGAFALASFIGGLFCRRIRPAVIAGAAVALLYALLVLIGLWHLLADANLAYLLGALTGACLVIFAAAMLGWGLRRGAAWMLLRPPSGSRTEQ
jgi:protein-S-isoprenylcysteine O-methyltransferase Ste14